jgi:hypothetical protein
MALPNLDTLDLSILFFFLGAMAAWFKSDLDIPEQIGKFLSLFLLLALGLKGGHEVRIAEDLTGFAPVLAVGIFSCLVIPVYMFYWLRIRLSLANAAALAASYGSVSAVTYVTALGYLQSHGIPTSGYMVAVMALMEIPAIIVALALFQSNSPTSEGQALLQRKSLLTTKSVFLLLGGFVIGFLMNAPTWLSLKPVVQDSFKGVLAFFLIDLGLTAQKQLKYAWAHRKRAMLIACILPLIHGSCALLLAYVFGASQGNQVLIAVLAGSASYIAAPAAIRMAIPEANPSLYISLPLAFTFPMNVLLGIPFYIWLSH